ncbi:hypothetical protein Fcan01_00769 [Folsomia candida]|uniref:Uncharacterized protein n=2 Tax=Folsomia candida TaxID=158441 RepID=A0A226F2M4_FOLCA|nr:hypothetical protein Fcan01_00769 [Folsomia candida]
MDVFQYMMWCHKQQLLDEVKKSAEEEPKPFHFNGHDPNKISKAMDKIMGVLPAAKFPPVTLDKNGNHIQHPPKPEVGTKLGAQTERVGGPVTYGSTTIAKHFENFGNSERNSGNSERAKHVMGTKELPKSDDMVISLADMCLLVSEVEYALVKRVPF